MVIGNELICFYGEIDIQFICWSTEQSEDTSDKNKLGVISLFAV
jgi:hypothetical protein